MRNNFNPFLVFSTILVSVFILFTILDYNKWVFPVGLFFGCLVFYSFLSSNKFSNRKYTNESLSKEIQKEIQEAHDRKFTYRIVKGLLNILPSSYLMLDRSGRVTFFNSEAMKIIPDANPGSHVSAFIRSPTFLAAIEEAINNSTSKTLEFEVQSPQFRQLEANIFFISNENFSNSFDDIFVKLSDISENIRVEKMRTDFVANASHELRTPLSSIIGYLETLKGNAKNDESAKELFLSLMDKQAKKMDRLIEDLMSLSRLEIQENSPIPTDCSLQDIIEEIVNSLKPFAKKHKVSVNNKVSKKFNPIKGDESQLRQLYSNLIENGIKYSGKGSEVTISEARQKVKNMVGIEVVDDGRGIAPQYLNRLTERFFRANSNKKIEKEGTGLGLSIVKHILIRHNGRLQIESSLGKGSRFITWLPKK